MRSRCCRRSGRRRGRTRRRFGSSSARCRARAGTPRFRRSSTSSSSARSTAPQEGDHLRAAAHAGELATRANDPAGLRAYWSKLSDAEQRRPRIARAAAKSFLALGGDREAADILVRSLERRVGARPRLALRGVPLAGSHEAARRGRSAGSSHTTRTRCSCAHWGRCACARSCGARRRRISRRASRSTTRTRRASRWASSSRSSAAPTKPTTQLAAALRLALAELRARS